MVGGAWEGVWTVVVQRFYSSFSMPQTTNLDLGFQRHSLLDFQTGRRPSVADRCEDYRRSERCWQSQTCSDGVPEILACETGLVTELFLDPVGECKRFIDVQLPSDGRPANSITATDSAFKESFEICACFSTHLSSWLYLAKRSERQGAPVLIWGRKLIIITTQIKGCH